MPDRTYEADVLRFILDHTEDMIYVIDKQNYELIFVNRGMRDRLPDAVPGRLCYEVIEKRREPCVNCALREDLQPGQCRVRHHLNETIGVWFNVSEMYTQWVDGRGVLVASARDVTHQKKQEEELERAHRKIMHNTQVMREVCENMVSSAIYRTSLDENGSIRLEYASKMLEQLSGVPLQTLYESMLPFFLHIHPEDVSSFHEKVRRLGASDDEETVEFRYILNGQTFWYKTFSRGFEQDGRIVRDGVMVDITAEKLREQELQATVEKAREASRSKSRLMATISHEIKNPMNAIIGFMDLLSAEQGEMDARTQQDYMRIVSDNANHMLKLLGDVLDISKMDARQMKLAPAPVNLNLLLEDIRSSLLVSGQLDGRPVELIHDRSQEDPAGEFTLDASRLRQVLLNLLGNALKFTDRGHVAFGYARENGTLRFWVEDTGIGIPPEKIARLGQPFTQVHDASLASKYGGTGLGLAVSFNLIKLMGGKVQVSSTPGKGTRFSFTVALM